MKNYSLQNLVSAATVIYTFVFVLSLRAATPSIVTYQGQMLAEGEKFTGTGQFKFAFVDAGTDNNTQATATATVTGGFITSISVDNGGFGYLAPPAVTITDGSGSGATATANIAGGMITSITVNTAGSGYSLTPTVTVEPPPTDPEYVTFWSNDDTSVSGSEPTDAVTVSINDGLFTVGLGDVSLANMTSLSTSVFDNTGVHLRIWFNDGVNGFALLDQDQRITSAPYATRAEQSDTTASVLWNDVTGVPAGLADDIDNDTTYSAGAGIDINSGVISNSSPDQTLVLTGSGATSVSGTYPNLNVSSTDNVNDADASTTNEIQSMSLSGNTLSLSLGGGSVSLASFASPWNNSGSNLYFNTGKVGIGDNSPIATLTVGNGDKLQIHGADGDVVFKDDQGSIRFANANGANAPMIQMFASGTNNTNRMVIAHSPSFSAWGLRYDDVPDAFNFIGDNLPVFHVQLSGGQRIGVGTFTPEARVHVNSDSWLGGGQIKLTETQFDYSRITMNNDIHDSFWDIAARSDTNLANAQLNFYHSDVGDIFSVNARGRIGINDSSPSYTVEIDGNQNTRIINAYNNLPTTTATTYNYGLRVSLSQAANTGFPRLYNVYARSTDSDAYQSYGLYGYASGAANNNYGVYAYAPTSSGYAGYFSGNVYSTGAYQPSDRKLKSNITSYSDGLTKVMALRPVTSYYDAESIVEMNLSPDKQYGFIADEVASVIPQLVKQSFHPYDEAKSDTAEGQGIEFDAVNYTGMIPVLVSALQEQQALIEQLRAELEVLKAKR